MTQAPKHIRKRLLQQDGNAAPATTAGALDLAAIAAIAFSSEDPQHPVEHMLDGTTGPGAKAWRGAHPDSVEQIIIDFDAPQTISRLVYEVEEAAQHRTQEIRIAVSTDGGVSYRDILVQEYVFSPQGATFQREDLRFALEGVTALRLTVMPHKSGSGVATLTSLHLWS